MFDLPPLKSWAFCFKLLNKNIVEFGEYLANIERVISKNLCTPEVIFSTIFNVLSSDIELLKKKFR